VSLVALLADRESLRHDPLSSALPAGVLNSESYLSELLRVNIADRDGYVAGRLRDVAVRLGGLTNSRGYAVFCWLLCALIIALDVSLLIATISQRS
jgi:hypothetical protein